MHLPSGPCEKLSKYQRPVDEAFNVTETNTFPDGPFVIPYITVELPNFLFLVMESVRIAQHNVIGMTSTVRMSLQNSTRHV